MPRIDPLQLLKCLSVLLSPTGGIKSEEEVQRLASLMTKFSKKLVSKCIYVQILKTTKTDLLGMFMAAGGWNLTNSWLSDAIVAKNWPLIQELLELLLMCPVDVERLKANNCPKLIKGLSKDSSNESVKLLASKLVEQWLKIVKGETEAQRAALNATLEQKLVDMIKTENVECSARVTVKEESKDRVVNSVKEESKEQQPTQLPEKSEPVTVKVENSEPVVKEVENEADVVSSSECNSETSSGQLPVYKITLKDGKRVLAKVNSGDKCSQKGDAAFNTDSNDGVEKLAVSDTGKSDELEKEEIKKEQDEPVKVNAESPKLESPKLEPPKLTKSKAKSEKSENNVEVISKPSKSVPKKSKDIKTDKDRKVKSDLSKEKIKNKEATKDKSKDKSKEKDRDRIRDYKDRESSKVKDKKLNEDKKDKDRGKDFDIEISEKDRATLAKLIPPAISKLGKIPKKPRTDEPSQPPAGKPSPVEVRKPVPPPEPVVTKKPSISIESRKLGDPSNRPKTVKTYNSKFRSTGLEEEVKPISRPIKKPSLPLEKKPLPPKLPSLKRPSPIKELVTPEKKMKSSVPDIVADDIKKNEKSGGVKLIPPRPKPAFLQESDMFMDALTASTKKEPRKRKRRISSSKDGPETKKDSPSSAKEEDNKDSTPPSSPQNNEEIKSPPVVRPLMKFYQDTLEENEDENEDEAKESENDAEKIDLAEGSSNPEEEFKKSPTRTDEMEGSPTSSTAEGPEEQKRRTSKDGSPKEDSPDTNKESDSTEEAAGRYPKGVLIYHKTRKGPKKIVRWKQEKELETIKYFELDETERVNVTKTFMDMKQMERTNEREAFLLARKLPQDDIMEEKTSWAPLIPIDVPPSLVEPGVRSREKDVQYAREKMVLQALYFSRSMIPDAPAEPDLEIHPTTDPTVIPLDDVTGNQDSVNDFQNTPWPEPKPMLIPPSPPPQFQPPPPTFAHIQNSGFQPGPQPLFPNQGPVPVPSNMNMPPNNMMMNNMNPVGPMNNMPTGGGDWRTGDGKVLPLNDMPMPMDMFNQGGPPMGMGMPGMPMGGPGPGPDMNMMNMNMMGGDDMGPGGPIMPQGYPMGAGGPPPGMFPFRGGNGNGGRMGGDRRGRGGNQMGPRGGHNNGQWYQNNGPHWQEGGRGRGNSGGVPRGGRWNNQNRGVCKHFRSGFCRIGDKCPYLHTVPY